MGDEGRLPERAESGSHLRARCKVVRGRGGDDLAGAGAVRGKMAGGILPHRRVQPSGLSSKRHGWVGWIYGTRAESTRRITCRCPKINNYCVKGRRAIEGRGRVGRWRVATAGEGKGRTAGAPESGAGKAQAADAGEIRTASTVRGIGNSAPIAVAVFPFSGGHPLGGQVDAGHLLPEFALRYIANNRRLQLLAVYFGRNVSKIGAKTDYWSVRK